MQEKYLELQMIDQQIKQFQEQLQSIDMKLLELDTLKQALKEYGK